MSYLSKIFNVVAGTGLLILGYNHYRTTQKLKRLRKLSSEKKRITSDLLLASQIQKSMMPLGHRILDGVEGYGTLVPAREIGGDLFDYAIRDGKLYMCIGDVCGKGAPAAMFMAYAHSMIWSLTVGETNPARIVTSLNNLASKDNVSCAFFTLFFAETGLTPHSFLLRVRLQNAKRMLRESRWTPVDKIAAAVGFDSPLTFASAFKRYFGVRPDAWRRRNPKS